MYPYINKGLFLLYEHTSGLPGTILLFPVCDHIFHIFHHYPFLGGGNFESNFVLSTYDNATVKFVFLSIYAVLMEWYWPIG